MNKNDTECPDCGSAKVVTGRYLGQLDVGGARVFRPRGLKALTLSLASAEITVPHTFQACLGCGLLWNRLDPARLTTIMRKAGTAATKRELGLDTADA